VVQVGGPAYRIGMGGGSASSVDVQGGGSQRDANLDFNAVQRGDAEMEQKLNRVIRACVELGDRNPIKSIHDQGAGGNGNVTITHMGAVMSSGWAFFLISFASPHARPMGVRPTAKQTKSNWIGRH